MMWRFIKLISSIGLFIPIKSYSQKTSDTVIIVYFKSGEFIVDIHEEKKLSFAWNDSNRLFQIKEISGYTDSVGSEKDNMLLAQKRNEYVIDLLNHFSLLKGDNYKVNIYGEQHPASYTDLPLNRRVEIVLSSPGKTIVSSDTGNFKIVRKIELKNIYFRPDVAVLEPSSMPYLDSIANILKADPDDIFEIKGHVNWNPRSSSISDSGYRIKMNELSTARARLIYEILIDKGIPAERMFWKGVGNSEMIFPNASTEEEKRKNMRVEILILKKAGY